MPNVLVVSLEGPSVSSRQLYPSLFGKLLSRTAVHESLDPDDALNYIRSGWPNIVLVSDPGITRAHNEDLLDAITDWITHGGTLLLIGFFVTTTDGSILDALFKKQLGLRWRVAEDGTSHDIRLHTSIDENTIRRASLVPDFIAKAVFLRHVPSNEMVYTGGPKNLAYAAFARVGLGKVGYVGDVDFTEEPERLAIAMCHLDRPEDIFQPLNLM
jgi:hypothetical protein